MAVNTTTWEATLQTKLNDTTITSKDMLLVGKALESTIGSISVSNISTAGTTQVSAVNTEGTTKVSAVNAAGTSKLSAVNNAGTSKLSAVNTAGTDRVSEVNNAGTAKVSAVNTAGTTQVSAVNTAGASKLNEITTVALPAVNLTGTIAAGRLSTAATQAAADNSTKIATTAYTDSAVSALAASAPETLNTLNELAAALGDDANYATTTTTAIVTKLPKAGGAMTGPITTNSTFDGRAVATDGTKLDGIESGATADQTQSDINGLGITATSVDLGNWTITESSGVIYFATSGTNKMKLDASGNMTVVGNITAYGSV